MLPNLHLLLVGQFVEHLAELSVHHCLARRVVGTVGKVVPPSQRRHQVFHVELEMREEVDVLASLEGAEGMDSPIDGGVDEGFGARGGKGCLFDGGDHFPHVETAALLHLEGSPVQIPVLPSKLVGIRVVLEILLRVYLERWLLWGTLETKIFSNLSAPIMVW